MWRHLLIDKLQQVGFKVFFEKRSAAGFFEVWQLVPKFGQAEKGHFFNLLISGHREVKVISVT